MSCHSDTTHRDEKIVWRRGPNIHGTWRNRVLFCPEWGKQDLETRPEVREGCEGREGCPRAFRWEERAARDVV